MALMYDEAAGNERAARRIYQECYLHRVTPSHTLFAKIIQRLRERVVVGLDLGFTTILTSQGISVVF